METIYQTYTKEICNKCKNKENCIEELRIRLDNSVRCDRYKRRLTGS